MTEIERKALALVNEVQKVRGHTGSPWNSPTILNEALYRAIEQHEAFKQEVSDAAGYAIPLIETWVGNSDEAGRKAADRLRRFILPKPVDPLVEALEEWINSHDPNDGEAFRTIIEKRGGKIVWGETP